MIGPYFKTVVTPLLAKLDGLSRAQSIKPLHLEISVWITGFATFIAFGLQYFGAGIVFFLLHRLVIAVMEFQTPTERNDTLFRDYFVITGSLMATLWTAGNYAIPVAFLFWAITMNLLGILSFKPARIIIDVFEISCALVLIALFPVGYIPSTAILFGAACLISLCVSYIQTFRKIF